jgi:hypothetical protein
MAVPPPGGRRCLHAQQGKRHAGQVSDGYWQLAAAVGLFLWLL